MNSRKQVWIAALCLISATLVTIALRTRPASVQAASSAVHIGQVAASQSASRPSNASLLVAAVRNPAMANGPAAVARVVGGQQNRQPILPDVEEFALTPPNPAAGVYQSTLSIRFPESQAERLASRIPMQIGGQNVVLHRSDADTRVFVTFLDFDWARFAEEQAWRKEQVSRGKMISVFDGRRFMGTEKMQFLDPAEIEGALQSHQPIQFTMQMLAGPTGASVYPDHELMMVNTAIVEDIGDSQNQTARTFDQCLPPQQQGDPNGVWTFNTLMQEIACSVNSCTPGTPAAQQIAENMLLSMLNNWNNPTLTINGFHVLPRANMGQLNVPGQQTGVGFLGNWPVDTTTGCGPQGQQACPSLPNAPLRLEAIVNRLDLGQDPQFPAAGQLRFVFSSTTSLFVQANGVQPCVLGQPFNIILEYGIPSTYSALQWAQQWNGLTDVASGTFSDGYLDDLQSKITDNVVKPTSCGGASCLSTVRTNEILVEPVPGQINANLWEQREFQLRGNQLVETTVAMTPDPSFNTTGLPVCGSVNGNTQTQCTHTTGTLESYISAISSNQTFQLTKGAAPPVPMSWINAMNGQNEPFLGGSALNGNGALTGNGFWDDNVPQGLEQDRVYFSSNTCNGCHGAETATTFQQVTHRAIHQASALSNFLLGSPQCSLSTVNLGVDPPGSCTESVPDPKRGAGPANTFGDIAHRVQYFLAVCGISNTCQGGPGSDLLLSFTKRPIGVH